MKRSFLSFYPLSAFKLEKIQHPFRQRADDGTRNPSKSRRGAASHIHLVKNSTKPRETRFYKDFFIRSRRQARIREEIWDSLLVTPVTVNEREVTWLWDL